MTSRALPLAVLLCVGWRAQAQLVRGRIVAEVPGQSTAGAVVVLTDTLGAPVARALADETGAFALRAPAAGRYGLRTLRIGMRPTMTGPYDVPAAGVTGLVVALADVPVSLEAVRVSDRGGCVRAGGDDAGRRDDEGSEALAVWQQARTALLASVLGRGAARLRLTTTRYERVAAPATGHVRQQRVVSRTAESDRPFASSLPPEQYAARGYRIADPSGFTYHGPDADVLLAPSFAATHCLSVARGERPDEIGVAFAPVERGARRGADAGVVVDVAGTLWLDRRSAELRRLVFTYTGLEPPEDEAHGSIDFLRLPTGQWVVRQWSIDLPRVEVTRFAERRVGGMTVGARETRRVLERWTMGGLLSEARVGDSTVWREPLGEVAGTIVDDAGAPQARAALTLGGTTYSTVADSLGRFRLDGLLPGRYDAQVRTPSLDAFGLPPAEVGAVEVRAREPRDVRLTLRRDDAPLARRCGRDAVERGESFLRGTAVVRGAGPARDAAVRVAWTQMRMDRTGVGTTTVSGGQRIAETRTDSTGAFGVCGVPRDRELSVTAVAADDAATAAPLSLRLTPAQTAAQIALVLVPRPAAATVAGRVHDIAGRPVRGAQVEVVGSDLAAVTDTVGRFAVGPLLPGTYLVRTRAVGYRPSTATFVLAPRAAPPALDIALEPLAPSLDAVTVRASATSSAVLDPSGFERRRRAGHGTFLTEEEITRRAAERTEQLFRNMPHVVVDTGGLVLVDRGVITLRDHFGVKGTRGAMNVDTCIGAQVFVDGAMMPQPFDVNQVAARAIRAIEVYRGAATTPPELRSPKTVCGTIAIWTK